MRVALVLNDDFSMWQFRGDLIRRLVARGIDVAVIVPPGDYLDRLESLGARCIPVPMSRFVDPLADLRMTYRLFRVFRRERFDLVHNMTVKPNIFGTFAARLAGVERRVCLVSGLGFAFSDARTIRDRCVGRIVRTLYRRALAMSDRTWFQNPEDLRQFVDEGLIAPEKGVVIRSGGINVREFAVETVERDAIQEVREEIELDPETRTVLMVAARMVWSKGVRAFVEAAESLATSHPHWRFVMICPRDPGSEDEVPTSFIDEHRSPNLTVIDTFRADVRVFMAMSDIVTLPSFYREGVPRTLLEGLAMGKPIVTCDSVGCREVVEDGVNGFLVPPRDSEAFADKVRALMEDQALRERFGARSRRLAEETFDERVVLSNVFEHLYQL